MPDFNPDDPANQSTPPFGQSGPTGLSTTPDDSNTNIVLNKIATDMGAQSGDVVTALDAIAAAINAKPSA